MLGSAESERTAKLFLTISNLCDHDTYNRTDRRLDVAIPRKTIYRVVKYIIQEY